MQIAEPERNRALVTRKGVAARPRQVEDRAVDPIAKGVYSSTPCG